MASRLPDSGYILGLDVGGKRIGTAIASVIARLPQPLEEVPAGETAIQQIVDLISKENVNMVVVGLPRNLSGKETAQTKLTRDFAAGLEAQTAVPVVFADESLSSVRAEDLGKKNIFKNVSSDSLAACFILEEYFQTNLFTDRGAVTQMKFHREKRGRLVSTRKIIASTVIITVLLLVAGVAFIRKSYADNLRPVSGDTTSHVVTIETGSTPGAIADILVAKGVIRSDWAFEWYVRNQQLRDELKAGTYIVNKSQSVEEIVNTIVEGKVATDLVTIVPGRRLDQIREALIKAGFNEPDVNAALEPRQWASHPALTDKPPDANLEGYFIPGKLPKIAQTTPKDIVKLALDEMDTRLTPEIRQAIAKQGKTLHQGIILASVIEREVSSPEDRAQVAQVFNKRLADGMRLESNATDDYSAIDPAYNTYKINSLPPGPISNFTESSLEAVAFPAQTDWTYFVSGDDKKPIFLKRWKNISL